MGFSSFLSSTPASTRTARPVSGFSAFLRVEEASLAPAPQGQKRVSLTTADGRVVSFVPSGKRKPQREPGPYARYVQEHIREFLDQGLSAPDAMVEVAKKYRGE